MHLNVDSDRRPSSSVGVECGVFLPLVRLQSLAQRQRAGKSVSRDSRGERDSSKRLVCSTVRTMVAKIEYSLPDLTQNCKEEETSYILLGMEP